MESKLKGVTLGKNSLKISLARFTKENVFITPSRVEVGSGCKDSGLEEQECRKESRGNQKTFGNFIRPGCSYSMVVKAVLTDVWVGQAFAFEMIAWLQVHGVPLHLWCEEVFSEICGRFGVVAKQPQVLEDDGDFSMVCVGVLVGEGKRILEEVTLNWQDKRYQVWVSEDLGDWIPDCLDRRGTRRKCWRI
ncbi:hypothetical protein HanHA300_Chr03g0103021 [Helianthus annuus]|nr:hypothetical protein HanHA300_Chr03g0103021 [Helianthus annuus]KAJ0601999.1 hypothetical protein HanIR_Chr03g0134911 [Helianthus annuus]KAJ0608961.1 hypothetical protein HanHA89_Chr03g0114701 [Helianthus annuus]KAJ0944742.1 hypothetical protein HanPSC8_Chr03g0120201 [Helianthus annuus]